jgi:DegV family protein with EDD domain
MIAIVTDSIADIPPEVAGEKGLYVVPALIHIGQQALRDGIDLSREAFYELLPGLPDVPTTSAPSPAAFIEAYERALRHASHVVAVHTASQLSGIFNAARLAAEQVAPDRIHLVDSGQVSMGLGWSALAGWEAARRDETVEGVLRSVRNALGRLKVYALLDTLEYLAKSGRVNLLELGLTRLLSIKPMVELHDGVVSSLLRVRTWSRAMEALTRRAEELAPLDRLAVMHANCVERAHELVERLEGILPPAAEVIVTNVTTVIGVHVGPGAVGVAAVSRRSSK